MSGVSPRKTSNQDSSTHKTVLTTILKNVEHYRHV